MSAVARSFPVGAVAFDLDGTLLDTIRDLHATTTAWLTEAELTPLSEDTVRGLVGKGVANLVRRALGLARDVEPDSLTIEEVDAALARYQSHYAELLGRETVLFPEVREGLDRLKAMGLPLAVVTNKASRFVRPHLDQAGIGHYFDLVIGADDLPTRKPDPGPLLFIARSFRVAPAELLMVGDSANDCAAARAAGCPVLVLPYGYSEGTPVDKLDCDGIVASIAAVADVVRPAHHDVM